MALGSLCAVECECVIVARSHPALGLVRGHQSVLFVQNSLQRAFDSEPWLGCFPELRDRQRLSIESKCSARCGGTRL